MTAKEMLAAIANGMHEAAVDSHIEGLRLARNSARIEQASRIMTEEQATEYLATLVREGLVATVEVESEAKPAIPNAPGGMA